MKIKLDVAILILLSIITVVIIGVFVSLDNSIMFSIIFCVTLILYFFFNKVKDFGLNIQLVLVILLNFTVIGSLAISPLLPIIRLDWPNVGGVGQHICTVGSLQRSISLHNSIFFLILIIGALLIICTIVGRAMCGWACPFGLFQDLLTRARTLLKINAKEISLKRHEQLSMVKYAILILSILIAISIGLSVLSGSMINTIYSDQFPGSLIEVAPYCQFCPTPILRHMADFYFLDFNPQLSDPLSFILFSIFIGFIIGAILIPRFWCRYLCPMGALSSFFNKVSIFSIRKDQSKCTGCNYCVNACPTRVQAIRNEDIDDKITDMNCIFCLDCVEACPEKALSFAINKKVIYRGGKKGWWEQLILKQKK